jgi:hypothetical protein
MAVAGLSTPGGGVYIQPFPLRPMVVESLANVDSPYLCGVIFMHTPSDCLGSNPSVLFTEILALCQNSLA